jgi:nicotinamidase-related amidase/type 1 glutamine amidotransferase
MNARVFLAALLTSFLAAGISRPAAADGDHALKLYTRARVAAPDAADRVDFLYKTVDWDARKTAVIICDMWDTHTCKGAAARVAEMAPRMNEMVKAARRKGALVIHAPSGTMGFYEGTPARKLAQQAPKVETKVPLQWLRLDPQREAALPIDDSDGGCDCDPPCDRSGKYPWTRQIATIEIAQGDAVTDSGEAYYLLEQRGIENVILMGVHTNMCVLGRPFGIRQMVTQGKNVVLVRDMTDAMYNSRSEPHVSHVRGTELVIEHVERHWCPTITSSDLVGGPAFRFSEDKRPHVAFIVSDDHYDADKTLPRFAQMLREKCGIYATILHGQGTADIPAMDELAAADCAVLFIRRLALPKTELDKFRRYVAAGNPLVGMRTASHAFSLGGKPSPEGRDQWPEFDADVLGGSYHGHGSNTTGTDVAIVPDQVGHPILSGVEPARWHSTGSLYNTAPVASDATVLMTGTQGDVVEPLTWTRTAHGRLVYIGLGHPDDFDDPQFVTLLANAIRWALDGQPK